MAITLIIKLNGMNMCKAPGPALGTQQHPVKVVTTAARGRFNLLIMCMDSKSTEANDLAQKRGTEGGSEVLWVRTKLSLQKAVLSLCHWLGDPAGRQEAPGPSEGPSPSRASDPVQGLRWQVSARHLPAGRERSSKRKRADTFF